MSSPQNCALTCPICDEPLQRSGGTLRCAAGHSVDIAREGYVNLIPAHHRRRGLEGDTPAMLRARRRFLEAGYFAPLLDLLCDLIIDQDTSPPGLDNPSAIAELGCGEGYYIGGIARRLRERYGLTPPLFGMDLSRDAVRLAARHYPEVCFFVGDINRRVYLPSGSLRALLNIFAPRNPAEFTRLLAPRGRALIVIPAAEHLGSAREEFGLLDIQEEKEQRVLERLGADLHLVDRRELRYALQLAPAAVADLIEMGPSQWHRTADRPLPIGTPPIATEAAFIILTLERRA
jgi:23S rRNA (guanine745-N1)-methyltransferase